jgi:hypothetical protein
MKKIVLAMTAIMIVAGCTKNTNDGQSSKSSSGGKTLEVLVIVPDNVYKGELADTLRAYFAKPCEGLNQIEPTFDLVQLNPAGFYKSDMFQRHRNIIIINLNDTNKNNLYQYTDYKAAPQNYFEFSMNNRDSLYAFIRKSSAMIMNKFYANEYKRIHNAFYKLRNVKVSEVVSKRFGFNLTVSEDFYVATDKSDFVWIRKEPKDASLGIFIYKEKIKNADFKPDIVAIRDRVTKENIPIGNTGNYMGVEQRADLVSSNVTLNDGVQALETRGLWRTLQTPQTQIRNFMGGAFVNYCFLDSDKEHLVMIDCYIYSPKDSKRDKLIQLESVVRNIKFK